MKRFSVALIAIITVICIALTGCAAGTANKTADLAAVMTDMEKSVKLPDMITLSADDLMTYYGIESGDVSQFAARICTTGINCDEIVLIEAKDSAAAKRVEEKLESRYNNQCAQFKTYIPEQYDILAECKVELDGCYVAMIVSPDAETLTQVYHDAFN